MTIKQDTSTYPMQAASNPSSIAETLALSCTGGRVRNNERAARSTPRRLSEKSDCRVRCCDKLI